MILMTDSYTPSRAVLWMLYGHPCGFNNDCSHGKAVLLMLFNDDFALSIS